MLRKTFLKIINYFFNGSTLSKKSVRILIPPVKDTLMFFYFDSVYKIVQYFYRTFEPNSFFLVCSTFNPSKHKANSKPPKNYLHHPCKNFSHYFSSRFLVATQVAHTVRPLGLRTSLIFFTNCIHCP